MLFRAPETQTAFGLSFIITQIIPTQRSSKKPRNPFMFLLFPLFSTSNLLFHLTLFIKKLLCVSLCEICCDEKINHYVESEVAWSCPTLCDPMDCSLPGSSLHGILQARVLEWVAISFSRGSSWPRDRTWVSHIPGRRFNLWATRKAPNVEYLLNVFFPLYICLHLHGDSLSLSSGYSNTLPTGVLSQHAHIFSPGIFAPKGIL